MKARVIGAAGLLVLQAGCGGGGHATAGAGGCGADRLRVSIASGNGRHAFCVEGATTAEQQERGLMFRPSVPADGGMLFWPYPPDGGPPRAATFWMKNTAAALDILFIRPDGTIATVAENAVPYSEAMIPSGEPVGAVLELRGGRAAELGIGEDDRVTWPGQKTGG